MQYFSHEEFKIMLDEIFGHDEKRFDMLAVISQKTLYGRVRSFCSRNPALYGKQYEDDIMQEIHLRLIVKCVHGFFLRNDKLNDNPNEFTAWIFTVAENVARDFAKKVRRQQFNEIEECEDENFKQDGYTIQIPEEDYYELVESFNIVMGAKTQLYIALTWLSLMLLVLRCNMTRIEATKSLVKIYEKMTLSEMLDIVICESTRIPWMKLEYDNLESLKLKLDKQHESGKRYGDMYYSDFYMKKGAKKSVSDWINKMDRLIVRRG